MRVVRVRVPWWKQVLQPNSWSQCLLCLVLEADQAVSLPHL